MNVQNILAACVLTHLTDRFEIRESFDVAHGPADFDDDDVGVCLPSNRKNMTFDFVGDMWDDLNRPAEVVTTALFLDDRRVDLAGGYVAGTGQVFVDESFVVPEV